MIPYVLHQGNSEDVLPEYPDNHFDSCVADGPYGIRFMGKAWDSFDIHKIHAQMGPRENKQNHRSMAAGKYNQSNQSFQLFTQKISEHVFRVLKPGGHYISFSSTRTFHRLVSGIEDAGFEIRDTLMWVFSSGFPKSHNLEGEWKGWGTALKPAYELICLARKPIEKGLTVSQNVKKWGTGALNIDACRVEGEPWTFGTQTDIKGGNYGTNRPSNGNVFRKNVEGGHAGRWPANLIHDGSEEVVSQFPVNETPSGIASGPTRGKMGTRGIFSGAKGNMGESAFYGDTGSASRFFYCAKTSRADRNEGCESFVKKPMIWTESSNPEQYDRTQPSPNNHPTVKPTSLMRYLCQLVTPKNGLILDPFMGSGSTGKAAMYEHMRFVGIDKEFDIAIAKARIEYALRNRDNQIALFS